MTYTSPLNIPSAPPIHHNILSYDPKNRLLHTQPHQDLLQRRGGAQVNILDSQTGGFFRSSRSQWCRKIYHHRSPLRAGGKNLGIGEYLRIRYRLRSFQSAKACGNRSTRVQLRDIRDRIRRGHQPGGILRNLPSGSGSQCGEVPADPLTLGETGYAVQNAFRRNEAAPHDRSSTRPFPRAPHPRRTHCWSGHRAPARDVGLSARSQPRMSDDRPHDSLPRGSRDALY